MNKILIVMPAFNEAQNLRKVLLEIKALNQPYDVLVINDGSEDDTMAIAVSEGALVVSLLYNSGYGVACQTGFKYAVENDYDFVLQMDSDGQHRAEDLPNLLGPLLKGQADIVIGSRFIQGGGMKVGFLKKMAIGLFKGVIKFFTGTNITDPSSGFQGLNRRAFHYYSKMDHYPEDYPDADVIIRMLLRGYSVQEVPAVFRERIYGKSMHTGLKPILYMAKVCMSIVLIVLRAKLSKGGD